MTRVLITDGWQGGDRLLGVLFSSSHLHAGCSYFALRTTLTGHGGTLAGSGLLRRAENPFLLIQDRASWSMSIAYLQVCMRVCEYVRHGTWHMVCFTVSVISLRVGMLLGLLDVLSYA